MITSFPLFAFIGGLGSTELLMIFAVVLLLFGGQKLPEFARGFGKSMREFKKATAEVEQEIKKAIELPLEPPPPEPPQKAAEPPKEPPAPSS